MYEKYTMSNLNLVKWKAEKLLDQIQKADNTINSIQGKEVRAALVKVKQADSVDDVPKQIGGTLFFKAVQIEDELDLDEFASEFRKIHEALHRDAKLEKELTKQKNSLDEKTRRALDKKDLF